MQKSMWLLAFLPCLQWFGPLVDGAVVLTTPSNLAPIPKLPRLKNSDFPDTFSVIDKERGVEIPAAQLFQTGVELMGSLAYEDFDRYIPSQAWSLGDIILGVSVYDSLPQHWVFYGFYFIFLLMKQEKDFRSGVFEVQYFNTHICDLIILPTKTSGSHLAITFTNVTQLDPPPSPIANNINSYSKLVTPNTPMSLNVTIIEPILIRPMDELDQLINFVDMLVTVAEPPKNSTVLKNAESIVPYSGVKLSLSLNHAKTPDPFTYYDLIWAMGAMIRSADNSNGQAIRGQILFGDDATNIGEIRVEPSNSAPSTRPLIKIPVNASTDTATARKRWSMA